MCEIGFRERFNCNGGYLGDSHRDNDIFEERVLRGDGEGRVPDVGGGGVAERVTRLQRESPNPLYHRDDYVDRPRAMGV